METTPPKNVMNIRPLTPAGRYPPTIQMLTNQEIQNYYQNIIDNWRPLSDVWAVRIAPWCGNVLMVVSGLYVNQLFRKKFNLREVGLVPSMLGTGVMGSIMFGLFENMSRKKILENDYCPICMKVRYVAMYCGCGVAYPIITGTVINVFNASKLGYEVPEPYQIHKMGKICWSAIKPALPKLSAIFSAYAIIGMVISHHTMESVKFVHWVIAKMHEDFYKQYDEHFQK